VKERDTEMSIKKVIGSIFVCASVVAIFNPLSFGQEKIEGKVVNTNLTACSVMPGKVGTCEGTLVLESKANGKAHQATFKVTRDTILKKGDEKLFLFQLQGAAVTIHVVADKGEKVAQSVLMKP
jgi:hypothetical protein